MICVLNTGEFATTKMYTVYQLAFILYILTVSGTHTNQHLPRAARVQGRVRRSYCVNWRHLEVLILRYVKTCSHVWTDIGKYVYIYIWHCFKCCFWYWYGGGGGGGGWGGVVNNFSSILWLEHCSWIFRLILLVCFNTIVHPVTFLLLLTLWEEEPDNLG